MNAATNSARQHCSPEARRGRRRGAFRRFATSERQLAALLGVAVLIGGGGPSFAIANLIVELLAIVLLAFNFSALRDFVRDGPRMLVWLVGISFALPVLQSLPLPPAVWQALPGRDLVQQSLALIGRDRDWFAFSVYPNRTMLAALSLVPVIAMLVLGHAAGREGLAFNLRLMVALGLFNVLLGVVQLQSAGRHGIEFQMVTGPVLYGTFGNRNSTGLFLAIALACHLAVPLKSRAPLPRILHALVAATLALGELLTQSRSAAMVLALIVALYCVTFLRRRLRGEGGGAGGKTPFALAGALALFASVGAVLAFNANLERTFNRFGNLQDARVEIWEDAWVSAGRFWPTGAGIATFDEVFQVDQSLEYLGPRRAGRAHDEILEVAIESGVAGLALVMGWVGWILARSLPIARLSRYGMRHVGASALAGVLLQSLVDYPLRNLALLCVAAFMVSLLCSRPDSSIVEGSTH